LVFHFLLRSVSQSENKSGSLLEENQEGSVGVWSITSNEIAIFVSTKAKERAFEYAEWKRAAFHREILKVDPGISRRNHNE